MRGYRVPSSLIDKIEREALHIGDFSYTDGMDKVIEAIKDLGEVELDNSWHTGTPTEDGWYLVQFKDMGKTFFVAWSLERFGEELKPSMPQGTVAWQKIEPYESTEERE